MPSNRRLKAYGLLALLTVCVLLYTTSGASSTRNSAFYTRTVAAIKDRQAAEARQTVVAEELQRLERVERLQKEHDVATAAAAAAEETKGAGGAGGGSSSEGKGAERQQKPIGAAENAKAPGDDASGSEKSVAGRKMMPDGKVVVNEKAGANGDADAADGVAKIGNVGPQASHAVKKGGLLDDDGPESEQDHRVETELNDILKKGPIIIFSKSYCPFSKKAKHILLDLYTITPPPYVVELDQHELGSGLQSALEKTTGRRTVPNVLINGKSIGGGDDVAALHDADKIVDTITSMGGKRVMKVEKKAGGEGEAGADEGKKEVKKREVRFKS